MSGRIVSFFVGNLRILAVIGVVMIVQVLELLLLQRKYDLFSGGFLQPYSYTGFADRLQFLAVSAWVDLFVFGVAGFIWFRLSDRLGARYLRSVYNWFFISITVMGTWLALKFKVLS